MSGKGAEAMKQYGIQGYLPKIGWANLSYVYDFRIPYMTEPEEAKTVLKEIIEKYQPNTGRG